LLKSGQKSQQNKYRPSIYDLPVEMVPVCLMGAHARGRVFNQFSLTSPPVFRGGGEEQRSQIATE
jgi:hypothetical protein